MMCTFVFLPHGGQYAMRVITGDATRLRQVMMHHIIPSRVGLDAILKAIDQVGSRKKGKPGGPFWPPLRVLTFPISTLHFGMQTVEGNASV